jgi:hypothetical protein
VSVVRVSNGTAVDHTSATSPFTDNSFTISALSNCAFIDFGYDASTGFSITSVTWGGVNCVSCGAAAASGSPQFAYAQSWYCPSPPTGNQQLIITFAGGTFADLYIEVCGYSGVNLVTPVRLGSYQTGHSTGTTASLTISSNSNDRTHTCVNSGGPSVSSTNQTSNGISNGGSYGFGSDTGTTTGTSITHTWTFGSSTNGYAMFGFSIDGDSPISAYPQRKPMSHQQRRAA